MGNAWAENVPFPREKGKKIACAPKEMGRWAFLIEFNRLAA